MQNSITDFQNCVITYKTCVLQIKIANTEKLVMKSCGGCLECKGVKTRIELRFAPLHSVDQSPSWNDLSIAQ